MSIIAIRGDIKKALEDNELRKIDEFEGKIRGSLNTDEEGYI
jgi:hypothetical protein